MKSETPLVILEMRKGGSESEWMKKRNPVQYCSKCGQEFSNVYSEASSTRLTPSSSCRTSESHKKQIRYVKVLYYITGAIAFVNVTSADLWSPVEKNVDLIEVGRDDSPRGCVCPHLMTKSPLLTTPTISLTHNCTRMLHARLQRIW